MLFDLWIKLNFLFFYFAFLACELSRLIYEDFLLFKTQALFLVGNKIFINAYMIY